MKDTRVNVRLTAVMRGHLAEAAGEHSSMSSVVRRVLEMWIAQKRAAKKGRSR